MRLNRVHTDRVLVVGAGSIGTRHLRNLRTLGVRHLAACDPDKTRLKTVQKELGLTPFSRLTRALEQFGPKMVLVCTPPVLHLEQAAQALQAGAHVFIEKPLSDTLNGAGDFFDQAQASGRVVQVGYNLRFHPLVRHVKALIEKNAIGRPLWARAEFGSYLPNWRPRRDYRVGYTARKDLGGGILLDGSHEIDYLIWLFGQPTEVMCMADKVSRLEVDVEDCAWVALRFPNRIHAEVHLDFIQRPYTRTCKIVGQTGTILCDLGGGRLYQSSQDGRRRTEKRFTADFNTTYLAQMQSFLECVSRRGKPLVGANQALAVLRVVEAAKASARSGQAQKLS